MPFSSIRMIVSITQFWKASLLILILQITLLNAAATNVDYLNLQDVNEDVIKRDWNRNLNVWGKRTWKNLHGGWAIKRNFPLWLENNSLATTPINQKLFSEHFQPNNENTPNQNWMTDLNSMDKRTWKKLHGGWAIKRDSPVSEQNDLLSLDNFQKNGENVPSENWNNNLNSLDKRTWKKLHGGWAIKRDSTASEQNDLFLDNNQQNGEDMTPSENWNNNLNLLDKRTWKNLHGGWAIKRNSPSSLEQTDFMSLIDQEEPSENLEQQAREYLQKRDWNRNLNVWGKRSWDNLHGGWAVKGNAQNPYLSSTKQKRSPEHLQRLALMIASILEPNEHHFLSNDFGNHKEEKRKKWVKFSDGWGKRNSWESFTG